jgi:hypothetical protein
MQITIQNEFLPVCKVESFAIRVWQGEDTDGHWSCSGQILVAGQVQVGQVDHIVQVLKERLN